MLFRSGVIGFTGSQGSQGVIGYTGSQGNQGVIGFTGSQGSQGVIGFTGSQGGTGSQGVIGFTGSTGYTGSQGNKAGVRFYFDGSSTVAGVGNNGSVRYNNATIGSVTNLYVNVNDVNGTNFTNWLNTFGSSTNPVKGKIILTNNLNTSSIQDIFNISSVSNNTTYYTLTVSYISGSIFANTDSITVEFVPSGNVGFTGSQGNQGNIGFTGSQGSQGVIGYTGSASGNQTLNTTSNVTFNNITTTGQIIETFQTYNTSITSGSTVTLNCAGGNIWNVTSSVAGNWTASLTNLSITTNQATNVTLIINQGSTPYIPNALTVNSTSVTINWQGGSAPTGNSLKKDAIAFSILQTGASTYLVFGQLVTFG